MFFLPSCKYNLTSGGQGTCLIYFLCILLSLQHSAGHQVGDPLMHILCIKSKAKHPSTLLSHHEDISQCSLPFECHAFSLEVSDKTCFCFVGSDCNLFVGLFKVFKCKTHTLGREGLRELLQRRVWPQEQYSWACPWLRFLLGQKTCPPLLCDLSQPL